MCASQQRELVLYNRRCGQWISQFFFTDNLSKCASVTEFVNYDLRSYGLGNAAPLIVISTALFFTLSVHLKSRIKGLNLNKASINVSYIYWALHNLYSSRSCSIIYTRFYRSCIKIKSQMLGFGNESNKGIFFNSLSASYNGNNLFLKILRLLDRG
jgi:hypothetical protein